ncbi:MAG: hypothetical protein JWO12_1947 [Frankiales bacterium]|nr:hypothetical protein [Frankiales bacterium]
MTSSVSVSHSDGGRVARVVLVGEHDVVTAHELSRTLVECCAAPVEVVLVDVARCTFADSTVLGALVGSYKRMTARDGQLVVINACGSLEKLLAITNLDEILCAPDGFNPQDPLASGR